MSEDLSRFGDREKCKNYLKKLMIVITAIKLLNIYCTRYFVKCIMCEFMPTMAQ